MEKKEALKDLDNLKPIDHAVIAKPHTPVYKMHRYFARRPYTVFNELIRHYSNPESIILDPFCGGGVTVIEGLRLKRKVIGVDINPMATFITRMEAIDVNLQELQEAFEEVEAEVKDEILQLYLTKCPKCKKETPADWFEWSYIYKCPGCGKEVQVDKAEKVGAGKYKCYGCKDDFKVSDAEKTGEVPIRIKVRCECGFKGEKKPDKYDLDKIQWIEENFDRTVKEKDLWYPKDKIFLGEKTRELLTKDYKYFYELFTKRNLLVLAILFKEIRNAVNKDIENLLHLHFGTTLCWSSKICYRKRGQPVGWGGHHYWLPYVPAEINLFNAFDTRFKSILKGKKYSHQEIGQFYSASKKFLDIQKGNNCWLLCQSATKLPLPDESIDAIITDPPYGGNVNYTELSDFWTIWLKESLGMKDGLIDNTNEAIENKYQGKGAKEYRDLMFRCFKECHRVLKPNRWMVMTFHNRDFRTWNAIHLAAHDAGFILSEEDGMIHQPAIQQYTTTLHQRSGGSMLGDFILSFKKAEKPPEKKAIDYVEIGKQIEELAAEAVSYHNGASLSTIYAKLIPFLLNNGLFDKIGEKEAAHYLLDNFEEREGKWYLKERLSKTLDDYLAEYSRSHYKGDYRVLDFVPVEARLEYLIRRLLYDKGSATEDEILNEIYTNLINSNAAEYGEISRVLNRIAVLVTGEKGKRKVWRLKEDMERQMKLESIEEEIEEIIKVSEESEHDLVITKLYELGAQEGFATHIGKTEQNKYKNFRKWSIPMANNVQYGIGKRGFDIVTQIDVLWLKGDAIIAAFEVEKTTTIDSGITRFRNLFATQPNVAIEAFLVVPSKRKSEVERKLKSPANIKDSLTKKIGYIIFDDLKIKRDVSEIDFANIKRRAV